MEVEFVSERVSAALVRFRTSAPLARAKPLTSTTKASVERDKQQPSTDTGPHLVRCLTVYL